MLAHGAAFDAASWEDQAAAIAAQGATVIAVEDISAAGILAAVDSLQRSGIADVALVGASAGADIAEQLGAASAGQDNQVVLLLGDRTHRTSSTPISPDHCSTCSWSA